MPESFDELLAKCTRTALKLELRDQYMIDDPAYQAWRAGDLDRAVEEYAGWTEVARSAIERGIQMKRVRIVSEPFSEYIAFEYAVTSRVNIAAGEQIRWVGRPRVSDLALPGNDVWIFDDSVLQFYLFAGDGRFMGSDVSTDPEVVKLCASAFEAAWERGADHDQYPAST
ncbi:DUF6879 family protein [Kribbella ginsengisoli]|uniref:DUF6879 domain-containing protein n=1 Tax=Kribbella ginsengisoli TaxID=363865 RepID=A0ABP6Z1R8_9ACTN